MKRKCLIVSTLSFLCYTSIIAQPAESFQGTKIKLENEGLLTNRFISLPISASQLFINDSSFYSVIHQLSDKLLHDIDTYDLDQHKYLLNKYYHTLAYIAVYEHHFDTALSYLDKGRVVFPNLGIANDLPERAIAISHQQKSKAEREAFEDALTSIITSHPFADLRRSLVNYRQSWVLTGPAWQLSNKAQS